MKRALFAVAGLLLVGAGAVTYFAIPTSSEHDGSFKDFIKNPDYWDKVQRHAEAEAADASHDAQTWDDAKVAAVVRDFLLNQKSSRDAAPEAETLQSLGGRTYPAVLALLGDHTLYEKLITPTGVDLLPEAPFNRACKLLGDAPPGAAVDVLAPFLAASSVEIRKDAALALAKTGAPSIVPFVKKALSDPDAGVRDYTLMGLQFAVNRQGLADTTRAELFPLVLASLHEGKNGFYAADVLFGLNSGQAKDYFLSDEVLRADSPNVSYCLKTLANADVPVPRDKLLMLIKSLESQKLEYPRDYALGDALRLLGQLKNEQDRAFLRQRMDSSNEKVASGASAGLISSYDLENFDQRLEDKANKAGFNTLSPEQKHYEAVMEADGEINNGGLAQFFANSSGDDWPEAVAGFQAMGMKGRLAILKEAVAMFGSAGPSTNRETRQDQLARLYRQNDKAFDALDNRYFDSKEIVDAQAGRYVLDHPESFR